LDYSSLKAAIIDYPDLKGEADVEANINLIVTLAEARIARIAHLAGSLKTQAVTAGQSSHQFPPRCVEVDRITVLDGRKFVFRPATEVVLAQNATAGCAKGCIWGIDGRTLVFSPDVGDFILHYYAREEQLSVTGTNWLIEEAPDLYLYAGLAEAARFSKEAEQEMGRYESAFGGIVTALKQQDAEAAVARSAPLRRK